VGLADTIRIALGRLTPAEQEERDRAARQRMAANDEQAALIRQRAAREPRHSHEELMEIAAGVSSLDLICHMDALNRIGRMMWETDDWVQPTEANGRLVRLDGGMVRATLSGPHVATLLFRTGFARHQGSELNRASARRVYSAVAAIVDEIDPAAGSDEPIPPVVLDARPVVTASGDDEDEPGLG